MITINDEDKDDYNHDINKTKNDNSNVNWYTFVLLYCKSFNLIGFLAVLYSLLYNETYRCIFICSSQYH